MIVVYFILGLLVFIAFLAILIRHYGPTSSSRLKVGSQYRIKGRTKSIGDFKIHGNIYLMKEHILDDFYDLVKYSDALLTKHNIPYTVAYGTLLGTVRHRGIMPWDDDADLYIHVPNDEYEKTVSALRDEMDRDGFTLRMSYDATYFHLCKKGAPNNFPYIDWYQYYQTYSDDQLYPIKRMPYEDYEVCVPQKHLECIDIIFNKSGKNDPLNNIIHPYPFSRYYSLWVVQVLKSRPAIHRILEKIAKTFFPD